MNYYHIKYHYHPVPGFNVCARYDSDEMCDLITWLLYRMNDITLDYDFPPHQMVSTLIKFYQVGLIANSAPHCQPLNAKIIDLYQYWERGFANGGRSLVAKHYDKHFHRAGLNNYLRELALNHAAYKNNKGS